MTPEEFPDGVWVTGPTPQVTTAAVVAPLTQVVAGLPVADSPPPTACDRCSCLLREGAPVVIHVARPVETPRWEVMHCLCQACATPDIKTPTYGAIEVQLRCDLALMSTLTAQQHQLCCTAPHVAVVSPPGRGERQ